MSEKKETRGEIPRGLTEWEMGKVVYMREKENLLKCTLIEITSCTLIKNVLMQNKLTTNGF